jgi:hypothetical protein
VPVFQWDEHAKEKKSEYRHQGLPALAPKWEKSKGTDVVEHLQRNAYGYGSQGKERRGICFTLKCLFLQ